MQSVPVAKSRLVRTQRAVMRTQPNRTTITHREFVADIPGSVAFDAKSYAINPGNSVVFPWLSQIAQRYESYVFRRLNFEYNTVSPSTTPGSLMLACDYDASDAPPLNKCALMSYAQATRSAPWQECRYQAKSGDLTKFAKERYVRGDDIPPGDIKTFDVANLFLATQGMDDVKDIGELYVEYTIELRTPQTNQPVLVSATSTALGAEFTGSSLEEKTYMGGAPTVNDNNPLQLHITSNAISTIPNDEFNFTGVAGKQYSFHVQAEGTLLNDFAVTDLIGATIFKEDHGVTNPPTEFGATIVLNATGGLVRFRYPYGPDMGVTYSNCSVSLIPAFT